MPIYEYVCDDCGFDFERAQSFHDDPLTTCPECGGSVRRVISPVGIIFKGSGWYITDSRRQISSKAKEETAPVEAPAGAADSQPAEAAADAKQGADATPAGDGSAAGGSVSGGSVSGGNASGGSRAGDGSGGNGAAAKAADKAPSKKKPKASSPTN